MGLAHGPAFIPMPGNLPWPYESWNDWIDERIPAERRLER
jgi:hypothetical protein